MPIRSQAQRAFLHIHHPDIAKRWEKETPKGKLPKHVEKEECTDMTTTEKKEKDTPKKLRWDYLKHGVSDAGAPGLAEAAKKKDLPSYSEVMEKFSELETKFGSGYKEIEGEGPGPGCFGVVGNEDYPFAESEVGEDGPPKDKKIKEGKVNEASLDFASLKDPAKFIDGIDDYMSGFKKDIDVLQAFAKQHAQKAPAEKKPALDSLANNLDMVKKTSDPLVKRVNQAIDKARATASASPAGGNPAAKPTKDEPAASGKTPDLAKTNPDAMKKTNPGMGFEPKRSAAGHVWSKTNPDMKKTDPGAGKPSDKKPERGMRMPLNRLAISDPKHQAPKGARADWEKRKLARQFRA